VSFNEALRRRTEEVVAAIHVMLATQTVPPAPNDARCRHCSLINACLPWVIGEPARLRGFQGVLFQALEG